MVASMNAPKILWERETRFAKVLTYILSMFISNRSLLSPAVPWMPPNFYRQKEPDSTTRSPDNWLFFFLFLSIYKALPMISWLCCYKCSPIQDLLHSISSTLLSFTLTLLFSFLIIVLSYLSWWCWYIFSYLQDLIHSIFSTLLSYTIDSSFSFHLEYIIFNILVVLLHIFLSPGPYPFYLFYIAVLCNSLFFFISI